MGVSGAMQWINQRGYYGGALVGICKGYMMGVHKWRYGGNAV